MIVSTFWIAENYNSLVTGRICKNVQSWDVTRDDHTSDGKFISETLVQRFTSEDDAREMVRRINAR